MFYKKQRNVYQTFDDRTFVLQNVFSDEDEARLTGEELKIAGDVLEYRVLFDSDREGYVLWVH